MGANELVSSVCSSLVEYSGMGLEELLTMYERYGSFDVMLCVITLMLEKHISAEGAEAYISSLILGRTNDCYSLMDGRIRRVSGLTCSAFRDGMPWLEIIKTEPFGSLIENAKGKASNTPDGFLND